VGGDGTAVDILAAIGDRVPVIGVPAGVKMHSAVFAVAPAPAARLADLFLHSANRETVTADVVDLDEAAARRGIAAPRLHGTLKVPAAERLMQGPKVRSLPSDAAAAAELGAAFRESMGPGVTYVVGPGSTNSAILDALGLHHTLLGVDVVRDGSLVGTDVDDRELARLVEAAPDVRVVVTPIGGQGFLFGRGNQQIASPVIARAGRDGLIVVGTEAKLAGLGGRPMLVDTGDPKVDQLVAGAGYLKVLIGRGRWAAYAVQRADQLGFDAGPSGG
jgi:predicted polyphosphate/ATP-dependent NAD kinase